jgi:hypothetical protein
MLSGESQAPLKGDERESEVQKGNADKDEGTHIKPTIPEKPIVNKENSHSDTTHPPAPVSTATSLTMLSCESQPPLKGDERESEVQKGNADKDEGTHIKPTIPEKPIVNKENSHSDTTHPPAPVSTTTSLLNSALCPYIQVTIPEIGASRDGSYMLYTLFVSLPHLSRSWTVSRRYNEFLELDTILKKKDIGKKRDTKTYFECKLPPKTPFYANKTDARLTRNRRRQLEAYLWERVYKENVERCRELALFLCPHLVWVDDSDIAGVNGLYVEREDRVGNANIYTRTAPGPSTTSFTLKRELYTPESDEDEEDVDNNGRLNSKFF